MNFDLDLNVVPIDPLSYITVIRGEPGSGKTSLGYEVTKQVFGDVRQGLLLAIKNEVGYRTIAGIQAKHVPEWDFLVGLSDAILFQKEKNHNIKFIVIDTADEMFKIAEEKEISNHNKLNPNNQQNTVNGICGGYGNGQVAVIKRFKDYVNKLRSWGYGVMILEHTKYRTAKDPDGDFDMLTSNLDPRYSQALTAIADNVVVIKTVRTTDKNDKLISSKRKLYFRNTGYIDAKSRFAKIAESVDAGDSAEQMAKNFLKVIRDAISAENGKLVTEKDEVKERETVAKQSVEEELSKKDELLASITNRKTAYNAKATEEGLPSFNKTVLSVVPQFAQNNMKLADLDTDQLTQILNLIS